MADDDDELFVSYYMWNLYVFWKQATPSPSEVAALHRIDPSLQGKSLADVTALVRDKDWWRLGPFTTEVEANALEEQLRSAGFLVERKWQ